MGNSDSYHIFNYHSTILTWYVEDPSRKYLKRLMKKKPKAAVENAPTEVTENAKN